jgi:hypothetical protein
MTHVRRTVSIGAALAVIAALLVPVSAAQALPGGTVIGWGADTLNRISGLQTAAGSHTIVQVSAGTNHSLALLDNGTVVGAGFNQSGNLTIPNFGGRKAIQIATHDSASWALLEDGELVSWGHENYAGDDLVAINAAGPIASFSVVFTTGMAVYRDGSVRAWGAVYDNGGGLYPKTAPAVDGKTLTKVAHNGTFAIGILTNGDVLGWGGATNGEIEGVQAANDSSEVPFVDVTVGAYQTFLTRADGTYYTWTPSGTLNDNATLAASVIGTKPVAGAVAHGESTVVIFTDGSVATWGVSYLDLNQVAVNTVGANRIGSISMNANWGLALVAQPTVSYSVNSESIVGSSVARGSVIAVTANLVNPNVEFSLSLDGGTPVTGTTSASGIASGVSVSVPTTATVGIHTLRFVVGTDVDLETEFTVSIAPPVPTITGTLTVGKTISVVRGQWPAGTSFSYAWLREGKVITNATSDSLVLTAADRGKNIQARITGTRPGAATVTATSAKSKVGFGEITGVSVIIDGSQKVGAELSASPGSYVPNTGVAKYQWYSNGVALKGATAATFRLTGKQFNTVLSVRLTVSQAGYTAASALSWPTSAIVIGDLTVEEPVIVGTPEVGKKLVASVTGWTPKTVFSYQWRRGAVPIVGATRSSYTPVAADLGQALAVQVVGAQPGYGTALSLSDTSAPVLSSLKRSTPKITGTAKVGSVLTAAPGSWSAGTAFGYEWLRAGSVVGTSSTYTLGALDKGKTLTVRVTGTLSGYAPAIVSSKASAKIK